jgi:ankyrin repeat protein
MFRHGLARATLYADCALLGRDLIAPQPLHLAVFGQHEQCVRVLLMNGADPDARGGENHQGPTSRELAQQKGYSRLHQV